jgi:histidine triad (HIT) family protein
MDTTREKVCGNSSHHLRGAGLLAARGERQRGNKYMSCLFCKIIAGEIPSKKVYEDDMIAAFYDIRPAAPTHVLCVPKIHIDSLGDIDAANIGYVSRIFEEIPKIAKSLGIIEGYRVVANVGEHGGQSVGHLHFHILGGKKLGRMG